MICRSQNGYKRVKMATAELEGALLEHRERDETDAGTSSEADKPSWKVAGVLLESQVSR